MSQEMTANTRLWRSAYGALLVSLAGGSVAVAASVADWSDRVFGLAIAVALSGVGFALVAWSKALGLGEAVQEREALTLDADDQAALDDEVALTAQTVGRRPLLVWAFVGSLVTLGAAVLSPILSLSPGPAGQRRRTAWAPGLRVVTADGVPIEADRPIFDQLATVFPEGHTTADDSQVVLLRVQPELVPSETAEGGAVDGWIAYSKICTHLGCSVGLLGIDEREPQVIRQLVCPCHQSVFDPLHRARPVGGPASRPLPQLPLAVDDAGFLIATADFDAPVGPATWNQR